MDLPFGSKPCFDWVCDGGWIIKIHTCHHLKRCNVLKRTHRSNHYWKVENALPTVHVRWFEGGLQSLPKLTFAGGVLVGDTAGFLNVAKIKGNHSAMKTGMIAAEALVEAHGAGDMSGAEVTSYTDLFKKSWVHKELYKVRNIRPGFHKGFKRGFMNAVFQTLGGWMLPYTLKNHADHSQMKPASECAEINYPKPDNVITFDRFVIGVYIGYGT